MKLPKKIPIQRALILQTLDKQTKLLTSSEIAKLLPPQHIERIGQALHQMTHNDMVTRDDSEGLIRYKTSKYGKFILANLAKIVQVDTYNSPQAKGRKGVPTSKKMAPPPPPPAPTFNLSPTAETISNGISALLVENENYRNLLLQLYNTIGTALQLNKTEIEQ